MRRGNKSLFRKIANKRIKKLFLEADSIYKESQQLADRYVYLARKIGMKYNVKIPKDLQKKFCKHCYSYLRPGSNCRVRLTGEKVVYYCKNCKNYMRFPY